MKTTAVRLYGVNDLRLETFELPEIKDDEILAAVISDSICMSTHKAAMLGAAHKRVPDNVAENPTIIGHEFCGVIEKVGKRWQDKYKVGEKFAMQTAHNYKGSLDSPGYTYPYCGADATHIIIPPEIMICDCLIPYTGEANFYASLSEPMSCIIGGVHATYHTKRGSYVHEMGIREGGKMAIMAGAGPMGLGLIDYIIHCDRRPSLLTVTDIDNARLARAAKVLPPYEAEKCGVKLMYVNTNNFDDPEKYLRNFAPNGFDDIFVFTPVKSLVEMADRMLGKDGCLNFFAGPIDTKFSAEFNFYNVHYSSTHIVGTSGGNTDDMREALAMMSEGRINPAAMITHICGLDAVAETTLKLDKIPGGKKLCYPNIRLPLTAIGDFGRLGEKDPMFAKLAEIVERNNGLWCGEAEKYLLTNAAAI